MGLLKEFFRLLVQFALLAYASQAPLRIEEEVYGTKMDTYITAGIFLSEVENSVVYTDHYQIFFPLPDLPDQKMPLSGQLQCARKNSYCKVYQDVFDINKETSEVLTSASSMFTMDGVPEQRIKPTDQVVDEAELQQPEVVKAGVDWYRGAKNSLANRQRSPGQLENLRNQRDVNDSTISIREKRSLTVLLPGLLFQAAKTFFFGKDSLLKQLTNQRSLVPDFLKPLTGVAEFASDLAQTIVSTSSSTRQHLSDFEMDMRSEKLKTDSISSKDEFSYSVAAITQNAILTQKLTDIHLLESAMTTCRDGLLPLGFVPPQLLIHRLKEIETALDSQMSLVFPSSDSNVYYNLKFSTCKYDNDGGLLGLKVLLRPKKSTFVLYQLKSFSYAWNDETCDMGIEPGFVVMDTYSGTLYPITALDESSCEKDDLTLCKLPQEANADLPRQHCLMTVLGEGSSKEIVDACALQCRKGSRITFTQLDQDSFVVAHLPKSGTTVKCGNQTWDIRHSFNAGALKVTLGCGCQLEVQFRVLAKSQRVICDVPLEPFTIRHVLPIHMSLISKEYVPFQHGRLLESKFMSKEFLDESWEPHRYDHDSLHGTFGAWYTNPSVLLIPFNLFSLFTLFVTLYKLRILQIEVASVLVMSGLSGAEAVRSDVVTCQVPTNVYWLLGTIIFLQSIAVFVFVFKLVSSRLSKLHHAYVQTQVNKVIANASSPE